MNNWFILVILVLTVCIISLACTSPESSTTANTALTGTTSKPVTTTTAANVPAIPASTTIKLPATTTPIASTAPSATVPQGRYGGVFRQLEASGPSNIGDPAVIPGIPTFYRVSAESLFYVEKDGVPIPRLATSWDFDPDGKYVIFHLRKGVKFQDGTDFNAEAVKFCLERGIKGQAPGLKPVTSVDVIDEYTVKVNWPTFDYSVWDTLGAQKSPSWIVSPTSIKTHDKDWPLMNIIGTGPFTFISYQRDVNMKFEKFKDYWQKGLPYLDKVEMLFVADQTTSLLAFKSGAAEMMRSLTIASANDLKRDGSSIIVETPGNSVFIAFSSKNLDSPFSKLKVRQALIHAVDSKALAQGIGGGYYLPSNQVFPPWNWGSNANIKGYPYNPAKAKQLLAEAGYPNGFKTSIYMQTGRDQPDMVVAVQAYLKAVGVEAEIKAQTAPAIAAMMSNTGWEGLMVGQMLSLIGGDPGATMQGMGFVTRGTYFYSVMRTDDTINLLNQANSITDRHKRESFLKEMSRLIIDEYALILPIYYTQSLTAVQPYVRDIGIEEFGYTYDKAWFQK